MFIKPVEKFRKTLLLLSLVITGFIIPKISFAAWTDDLAEKIFWGVPWAALRLAAWVVSFGVELAGKLVNLVLSGNFITLPYTNPAGNPIIQAGLNVTQSLVNMILVLVLIYIALATILRLQEYQAQRLLPTFIVIALLVNFTPVICGLIVDASNIIMNFFVQAIHTDSFGGLVRTKLDGITNNMQAIDIKQSGIREQVIELIFLIPFMAILGFILLIFALIFTLRYFAIWLLVILSPIAFVAYILPITRPWWRMWWSQFLNWCFIGVTCCFFLYLSLFFTVKSLPNPPTADDLGTNTTREFMSILPQLTGIVFLGLGLMIGLKTSAMGAGVIVNFAQSKGRAYAKTAAKYTAKGTAMAGAWTGRKARETAKETITQSEKTQRLAQRMASTGRIGEHWGEKDTGLTHYAKMGAGKFFKTITAPGYHLARRIGGTLGPETVESQKQKIKKEETAMAGKSSVAMMEEFNVEGRAGHRGEQLGIINTAIQEGKLKDLMDQKKFGKRAITEQQLEKLFLSAKSWDADKNISDAMPHIAAKYISNEKLTEAKTKNPKVANRIQAIVSKMKSKDYESVSEQAVSDDGFIEAVTQFASGRDVEKLVEKNGQIVLDRIEKTIRDSASRASTAKKKVSPEKYLKQLNPALHKYLTQSQTSIFINLK